MSIPDEITMYKNLLCTKSDDFIWGREIDHKVVDALLDFWDNQQFLTVAPGQLYAECEPTIKP